MTINIRSAVISDLAIINNIITAAITTWELPERVKRLTLPSYHYTEHDLQHMHIVVAEQGLDMVGVAAWEPQQAEVEGKQQDVLLLHGVYVNPQHHGQGIGRTLFNAALQAARDTNLEGLLVKAQKGSEGFYTRMGMRALAVTDTRRDFEKRYYLAI